MYESTANAIDLIAIAGDEANSLLSISTTRSTIFAGSSFPSSERGNCLAARGRAVPGIRWYFAAVRSQKSQPGDSHRRKLARGAQAVSGQDDERVPGVSLELLMSPPGRAVSAAPAGEREPRRNDQLRRPKVDFDVSNEDGPSWHRRPVGNCRPYFFQVPVQGPFKLGQGDNEALWRGRDPVAIFAAAADRPASEFAAAPCSPGRGALTSTAPMN